MHSHLKWLPASGNDPWQYKERKPTIKLPPISKHMFASVNMSVRGSGGVDRSVCGWQHMQPMRCSNENGDQTVGRWHYTVRWLAAMQSMRTHHATHTALCRVGSNALAMPKVTSTRAAQSVPVWQ